MAETLSHKGGGPKVISQFGGVRFGVCGFKSRLGFKAQETVLCPLTRLGACEGNTPSVATSTEQKYRITYTDGHKST